MESSARIARLAVGIAMLSLLAGFASLVWALFGMPGWFFVASQIWLWTIGLPTMLAVLGVTAVWGIPGWTTLPLWIYIPTIVLAALALQYASILAVSRLRHRIASRRT